MKKMKWSLLVVLTLVFVLSGCAKVTKNVDTATPAPADDSATWFTYTKYEPDLSDNIFLGEKDAKHTIELVFDYSCPWCKKWMGETLPQVKEKFVDTGEAKYVSQPVALLNLNSLYMAEQDYLIKKNLADKYYDIQSRFASDNADREAGTWGNEAYIRKVFTDMKLDYAATFEKSTVKVPDMLTATRAYTKKMGVVGVPTVYVDGIKVSDPFSVEEIGKLLKGEIKEGQKVKLEEKK